MRVVLACYTGIHDLFIYFVFRTLLTDAVRDANVRALLP